MTTKYKIIGGFVIMILLMGAIAAISYSGLQTASSGFNEYRRLARFNVIAGFMEIDINGAVADIYAFDAYDRDEAINAAQNKMDEFIKKVDEAETFVSLDYTKEILTKGRKDAGTLKELITTIQKNLAQVSSHYQNDTRAAVRSMNTALAELAQNAAANGNTETLGKIPAVLIAQGDLRTATARLAQSRNAAHGDDATTAIGALESSLKALEGTLTAYAERELFKTLREDFEKSKASVNKLIGYCAAFHDGIVRTDALSHEMMKYIHELDLFIGKQRNEGGERTLANNSNAQTMLLGLSVAGIVIGALLAAYIIFGIVRILAELSRFAEALANGNFAYNIKVTEKGEIGRMTDAMLHVPTVLKSILDEYQALETTIAAGTLQATCHPDRFNGDFATLIRGTDRILARFITVLDSLPSPVVMLDKDLKACYMNAAAQGLAGTDFIGKTCRELFDRDDFASDTCALTNAVKSKRPAHSETRAHPQGITMDITYTAVPMLDSMGNIASVLQLITDITTIKDTQRTIMQIAEQASGISSRVAAASEQLSAQVEQVSRGAEMQRSRVESTASAMTEMNSTVLEVARNAGQASEQSELTREKANNGADLVNKVVHSINLVDNVATTLQGNMQELGDQAESIGGVMNVISDIADQTNLLALNAAIEAARAGEAGRGFAVVADEVRKLAEKTMEATHEVGSSIQAIQQSARTNINEVGSAVKSIHDATDLANSSGEALKEIVDLASANSSIVASIATAAEEQSATSEEINRAIDEISQIVGDTTDGMVQSSSAIQELSSMAQELREVMERLR